MLKNKTWLIVLSVILILSCLFSLLFFYFFRQRTYSISNNVEAKNASITATKEGSISGVTADQTPNDGQIVEFSAAGESLRTLSSSIVPERDIASINKRFIQSKEVNVTPIKPTIIRNVGDKRVFWILNTTSHTYKKVTGVLVFISPHAYFWIQDDLSFNLEDIAALADIFENRVYPTDHAFFGSEPIPGIDGDVHISILYANGLGYAAGLFSSSDTVTPDIDQYSNQAEMFYISADYVDLSRHDYVADIMAHELQHLILYAHDKNETSWITEGFSGLATFLNGYGPSEFDPVFAANPNTQLTFWPGDDQGDSAPNYGASFMFMKYFLDRFGEAATKLLVAEPANDYQSVDKVLQRLNYIDPESKFPITGNDLFRDWTITNLINNRIENLDDRFKYKDFQPPIFTTENITDSMVDWLEKNVNQFGTRYYEINCKEDCNINLQGYSTVKILPPSPHSGKYYVWSNKGDESEMTFSKEFDFQKNSGRLTMEYWTWYDIEKDYDYLYLTASEDGTSWSIIKTPGCTVSNPTGSNFGCGYSGKTKGWVQKKVDLSKFAGKKVTIKFDYITDLAVNGEGLVLDDISIPEVGYSTDFESDQGGWHADGFVRIQNQLPQEYLITFVHLGKDVEVIPLFLDQNGITSQKISATREDEKSYLIVSGITRYTITPAEYKIKLSPQ